MNELHGQLFKGISSIFGKEVSDHHCSWLSYPTTDKPQLLPYIFFPTHGCGLPTITSANCSIDSHLEHRPVCLLPSHTIG